MLEPQAGSSAAHRRRKNAFRAPCRRADPFFLYLPFSHVHTTATDQPEQQFCGCPFKNATARGAFGDALAEVDWVVGELVAALQARGLEKNTLILFTGDNGPWLVQGKSGGSTGLLSGRFAGYWNVGKGSTWEGGIREAGFASWPGVIAPFSRSSGVVRDPPSHRRLGPDLLGPPRLLGHLGHLDLVMISPR